MCGLRVTLSKARPSSMGIGIGWLWGGETCGQIPTYRQSKSILGGPAGVAGVGLLFYSRKSLSMRWNPSREASRWPGLFLLLHFCSMFIPDINITERTHIWKTRRRLWWSDVGTGMLCSISFSRRWESPVSWGWERGRPFGQAAIFLLFQEFGKAFEPSPVKITFGARTVLSPAS